MTSELATFDPASTYDGPIPASLRSDPGGRRVLFACHAALTLEARALRRAHAEIEHRLTDIDGHLDILWRAVAAGPAATRG